MHVLIFESNLMWTSRLAKTLKSLGHTSTTFGSVPAEIPQADAAIIYLGSNDAKDVAAKLKANGTYVIGHAGHKEKHLHELGREIGCDRLATNSELTFKLDKLLPG